MILEIRANGTEMTMIQMQVAGLGLDAASGQPIIVLGDMQRRRALPICVGAAEYNAIAIALSGQETERPLTHDLLLKVLQQLGGRIIQVEN